MSQSNIPFLQISRKQPPFSSKVYLLKVKRTHQSSIRFIKCQQEVITSQPQTTTLNTSIPSVPVFRKHYHQFWFTEKFDPIAQAQYPNVILEDKRKHPIAILKGNFGHIFFPEGCKVTQPHTANSTIYSLQSKSIDSKPNTIYISRSF